MNFALSLQVLSAMKDIRQIDVRAAPHEARRHDADDRSRLSVELQMPAENPSVAAKLLLPEFIAQHGHWLSAVDRVRCDGGAADQRRDAHHVERIHGAVIPAQALRIAVAG